MKIHEIVNSDKEEFAACKNDLMMKVAMDGDSANDVAESIRELFLPKLLEKEGLEIDDLPVQFKSKMTDKDEDFADETPDEDHDEEYEDESEEYDEDHEDDDDEFNESDDDSEVDDEIATIHISVPADKLREVESALEQVLGDTAKSKDQANVHKDNEETGEKDMDKKEIEARKALRKTILAAMQDDDESESVSRSGKFDYDKSEQYREEDYYNTKSMGMTDPDFKTLDYAESKVPNFTDLIANVGKDLGLTESVTPTKFDGAPEDADEYKLDFSPFDGVPSQGNADLYNEAVIPSEGKIPLKRTVNSSVLGEFDADAAEEVLADALRTAGVEDEDLGKLTYAEALELYRAIRTAGDDRKHYSPSGKMDFPQNDQITDPDTESGSKKTDRMAVTEDSLSDAHTHKDHPERVMKSASIEAAGDDVDAYASMLKKMMRGDEDHSEKEAEDLVVKDQPAKVDMTVKTSSSDTELFKARLKTAYACASKLALSGILPSEDVDAYTDGMLSDGLSVNAMIRQTKMQLANAAAIEERYAANGKATRTASTGITFNPSVRTASADLSGVQDLQNALRGLNWTAPRVENGMEE